MLSRDDARARVVAELAKLGTATEPWLVMDEQTIETDWGWVFFYNTERYLQTRDTRYALFGNAPFTVNRHTGEVRVTGTAHPIEHYIRKYERELARR
jgi:hypothetical protein